MSFVPLFAARQIRTYTRNLAALAPAVVVPLILLIVLSGLMESMFSSRGATIEFMTASAVMFSMTGFGNPVAALNDLRSGLVDRLAIAQVPRGAVVAGTILGDAVIATPVASLIALCGVALGARPSVLEFVILVACGVSWSVAFGGLPYALAYGSNNSELVANATFLWLPVQLITTAFVPRSSMSGWMSTIVGFNPATHVLAVMRSSFSGDFSGAETTRMIVALALTAGVSLALVLQTLGRAIRWTAPEDIADRSVTATP